MGQILALLALSASLWTSEAMSLAHPSRPERKRALDQLEGDDFTLRKRALDTMEGDDFGFKKRALDNLEGDDFVGLRRRRALDMLEGDDFGLKKKRALDMLEGDDFGLKKKRALDMLEGDDFGLKKRAPVMMLDIADTLEYEPLLKNLEQSRMAALRELNRRHHASKRALDALEGNAFGF